MTILELVSPRALKHRGGGADIDNEAWKHFHWVGRTEMVADMDRRRTRRLASVEVSGAMVVCVFLAVSIAPALAQVPDPGDLIEETTGDIDDITTGVGNGIADAVDEATGDSSAGDIVRDTTGKATGDLVGDTGAAVDDALDDAVGSSLQPQPNPEAPASGNGHGRGRFLTGPSNDPQRVDR